MPNLFESLKTIDIAMARTLAPVPPPLKDNLTSHSDAYIGYSIMRTVFVLGIALSCVFWIFRALHLRVDYLGFQIRYSPLKPNVEFVADYSHILSHVAIIVIGLHVLCLLKRFDIKRVSIFWWHPHEDFRQLKGAAFYKNTAILTAASIAIMFFPTIEYPISLFDKLARSEVLYLFLGVFIPYVISVSSYFLFLVGIALIQAALFSKSIANRR